MESVDTMNKKTAVITSMIAVFLFWVPLNNVHGDEFQYVGTTKGEGTHFEITNSDYLNITLKSSEYIKVRMESVPNMVTMMLKPVASSVATRTTLTLSGFLPLTTYYLYKDSYQNLTEFTTDEYGSYSYPQDITIPHIVFLQPQKSTKFLRDDVTGGDCITIGTWNFDTRVCVLSVNVNETIQIDSDNITLDGNSFTLLGSHTGSGVYLNGRSGVTVRNMQIRDFTYAISVYNSNNILIENNNFVNVANGAITLSNSHASVITGNTVTLTVPSFRRHQGFILFDSTSNIFNDNTITLNIHADPSGGHQGILLFDSNNNEINSNHVADTRQAVLLFDSYNNSIHCNTITNNLANGLIIFSPSSGNEVYNNNFINNPTSVVMSGTAPNIFNLPQPIGGNYWDNYDTPTEGCNDTNSDNFCDTPYVFPNEQDDFPWAIQDGWKFPPTTSCAINCYSNVLFLPGHQASRLYKGGVVFEDQLWEPNIINISDFSELSLSSVTGESVNDDIYTKDIIDESYTELQGFNVYKNFIDFMNENVEEGLIEEWKALPYDWRLDFDQLLSSGKVIGGTEENPLISYTQGTSSPYIFQELERLVNSSRNGKVTLITHSNGGLLAKYLLNDIANPSHPYHHLFTKVDKVIMVAAPQAGTPKAIEGLLHVDSTELGVKEWGIIIDEAQSREFAENMLSAYNLLPSKKYFDRS